MYLGGAAVLAYFFLKGTPVVTPGITITTPENYPYLCKIPELSPPPATLGF